MSVPSRKHLSKADPKGAWSFIIGIAILAALLFGPQQSYAADFATALKALNVKSSTKKLAAIDVLAKTGDGRAIQVLQALTQGQLYAGKKSKTIAILKKENDSYTAIDPINGTTTADVNKRDYKKIRVNNRIRKKISETLAGLTLFSNDPILRMQAANDLAKALNKYDLVLLRKAIDREAVDQVKSRMLFAETAIIAATGKDLAARIEAIATLALTPSQEVKSLLASLKQKQGIESTERDAIKRAMISVDRELKFWGVIQNIFQGISLGSVLLLAAIGLAITFGVMGVINMAHGELIMIGAYTVFVVQNVLHTHLPYLLEYSLIISVPAAFLISGSIGVLLERGVIRFLYGRPLETLLATWGISLIIQQAVRTIFGPTNREVQSPTWMSGSIDLDNGLAFTVNRISIIIFSFLVIAGIALVLKRTAFGLQMRAVTQNRTMASNMGIRTGWVDAMTFGLGAGIAGVAGVALSQIDNVSPNLGQGYIIDSFLVVVFGGVGNIWGTMTAALTLGVANKFIEPFAGAVLAKIVILIAVILFIQKRPRGLFPQRGRAAEAL